ncbi:hypothetical protein D8779_11280 [Pseudomonas leptonychotis]|uniref:Uncharacterized protein n=1 Tax=Pseudomonas leptonychotis TaxID=2448482 RepID=A0A4T1ZWZ5_9PSED|nr:hypothetical protein D8779_11280 [Pseudomonas leptonychotis]
MGYFRLTLQAETCFLIERMFSRCQDWLVEPAQCMRAPTYLRSRVKPLKMDVLIILCTMQGLFICDFLLTYLARRWVVRSRVASATAEF